MRTAPRVVILLVLPMALTCLFTVPVRASEPIGGPELARRGYVWDHAGSHPPRIVASSYVIADATTGQVLAAKDPHGYYRPASTLKLLTSITLIPRLDPDRVIHPSRNAVNASGSAVGLDTRWKYTVRDLFSGLLMQSGNDAAIALAEANGGLPATLADMNAEAHRIQANDTVARTPNGLDDDPPLTLKQQHSSAYDLALMVKQGLALPDFRRYVGQVLYDFPAPPTKKQRAKGKTSGGYQIGTHDHLLLGDRYPGMVGGKNGYTSHAMASFAGAASRNGHTIVISLMHAQGDFWGDARRLLTWGFANTGKVKPVGTLVSPIPARPAQKKRSDAAGSVSTPSRTVSDELPMWTYAVGGTAALVLVAGALLMLRRRRTAATATGPGFMVPPGGHVRTVAPPDPRPGPPGEQLWRPADAMPDRVPPRGDVKVAGAPLRPPPPDPEETVVRPSDEAERTVVEPAGEAEETVVQPVGRHERDTGHDAGEAAGKERAEDSDDGDGRTVTFGRPPKRADDEDDGS